MGNGVLVKEKPINVFSILILLILLSGMGYQAYDITSLRYLSYVFECVLIAYVFTVSKRERGDNIDYKSVLIVSLILGGNYLISDNDPEYTDLLKYLGYFGCYRYGVYMARHYNRITVNKEILYLIIIVPALLVAIVDNTVMKNLFFKVPNGFVYLGVAMGGFYLIVNERSNKTFVKSIIISAFYILICSSLGVVVAAFFSIIILNLKKSHIPYLLGGVILLVLSIIYIDIPLFIRMRDVLNVWSYVYDQNLSNIQDVDFMEIKQLDRVGEREDSSSSVWRIVQWITIFKFYIKEGWTIPFGMGAGFSVKYTSFYPHNDYLLVLAEYGLIVFIYFGRFVRNVYRRLKNERMIIYFILTMLCYHFTENLLNNFPPGALLYFIIGWSLCKYGDCNLLPFRTKDYVK